MNSIKHLQPLLEPQERLNQLISATVRHWGGKVVDLSYANIHQGPDEEVLRALELSIRETRALAFQYTPYGGLSTTRRNIAARLGQEYGLSLTFKDIVMMPGAMAGLNVVFGTLFDARDELIVLTPCWQDYPLYASNLGIPIRFVPLAEDKHLDLAAIERALDGRTRGLVLSHPCCPTGVLYRRNEIEALATLLSDAESRFGTHIYLIADEVHRQLVWEDVPFISPLTIYPRSLSIYSFGKAMALQGQRIGYVAVSPRMPENPEVRQALERTVRLMGYCAPTELMQRAVCRLVDYRPRLDRLADNQRAVRHWLRDCSYEVCEADATFFVYVKCPIDDDFQFVTSLASFGVLVMPSTVFHERGFFRISLTGQPDRLAAALPAFSRVLEAA